MKLRQIREYSKESLKGIRTEAFMMSLYIPAIVIFFRLFEICISSIVLYFGGFTPVELFSGTPLLWIIFDLICIFLKIIMLSAAIPTTVKKFSEILRTELPEQKYFNLFKKNFFSLIIIKIISVLSLMPAVLAGFLCIKLIIIEKGNFLFLSVHMITIMIISLFLWIWIMLGISALPFLISKHFETGIFRLVFISFKIMKKSRYGLLKIILFYFFYIIIPFGFIRALPEFFTSLTLYINICIKEAEYIGGENLYIRKRKSHNSSKISYRKKRSIKAAADKA